MYPLKDPEFPRFHILLHDLSRPSDERRWELASWGVCVCPNDLVLEFKAHGLAWVANSCLRQEDTYLHVVMQRN